MEKLFGSFVGYALALRQSIYNNYKVVPPKS
jgi:nitrate/nitrite transporter NarK